MLNLGRVKTSCVSNLWGRFLQPPRRLQDSWVARWIPGDPSAAQKEAALIAKQSEEARDAGSGENGFMEIG